MEIGSTAPAAAEPTASSTSCGDLGLVAGALDFLFAGRGVEKLNDEGQGVQR